MLVNYGRLPKLGFWWAKCLSYCWTNCVDINYGIKPLAVSWCLEVLWHCQIRMPTVNSTISPSAGVYPSGDFSVANWKLLVVGMVRGWMECFRTKVPNLTYVILPSRKEAILDQCCVCAFKCMSQRWRWLVLCISLIVVMYYVVRNHLFLITDF